MPSTRARSLPRPPGTIPIVALDSASAAADLADQPVAAHHHGGLAGLGARQRLLDAVLEAACDHGAKGEPAGASWRSTSGSSLRPRPEPEDGLTSSTCRLSALMRPIYVGLRSAGPPCHVEGARARAAALDLLQSLSAESPAQHRLGV